MQYVGFDLQEVEEHPSRETSERFDIKFRDLSKDPWSDKINEWVRITGSGQNPAYGVYRGIDTNGVAILHPYVGLKREQTDIYVDGKGNDKLVLIRTEIVEDNTQGVIVGESRSLEKVDREEIKNILGSKAVR